MFGRAGIGWLRSVPLLVAVVLAACASTPPAPQVGQTPEQVAEQQRDFTGQLQFVQDGSRYAVGTVYGGDNRPRSSIVFIDGRVACSLSTEWAALLDWRWVSQPDGLEYLAAQLRGACGLADKPPERYLTDAEVPIPEAPPKVAESETQDSEQTNVLAQGAMETLFYTAGIVLSPIILAVGVPTLAVGAAMSHTTEGKRAKAGLGISAAEAEQILGTPDARFNLVGSDTEVLAYISGAMDIAGNWRSWYVGVRDGRVIWTHRNDEWLAGLAGQAISQAKKEP